MGYFNIGLSRRVDALRDQLDEYKEKEGKSYVVERISKQMEDIAYQQKDISEKQREEAVFQMGVAEQMRMRAEEEQRKAEEFSRNAVEARNMAESQRELAVQQQLRAEYARNVADTLSNVALGRALALLSNVQYRAGNKDVAALLAYASWKYTSEYKGNVYQPVIFNALGQTSESFVSRNLHKGGVTKIVQSSDGKNSYVSVSNYGEVNRWRYDEGFAGNEVLFSNPEYSFRDVYWDENNNSEVEETANIVLEINYTQVDDKNTACTKLKEMQTTLDECSMFIITGEENCPSNKFDLNHDSYIDTNDVSTMSDIINLKMQCSSN